MPIEAKETTISTATVTSKGQITIPVDVRRSMHLETGDRVELRVRDDGVVELLPTRNDLDSLFGILKPKVRGVTIEQMNEIIRKRGARA